MKLTYLKYHGNCSANMFLNRSGFLHKFWRKNAESQFFDKDKQAWQLIIASVKAFDSLLSIFSHYFYAGSTKI